MLVGWHGRLLVLLFVVGAVPVCSRAADVQRIDLRFATDGVAEAPDFRQHVVPLIGRLGCNGRACHGSFQGQGGLRLSLFGYDFKADHDNLLAGDEPRTNLAEPAASLILRKPLEEEPHEGGRRLTRDTWQYRVLRTWIEAGAKESGADAATFVRLEVTPAEIVAASRGDTWQLKAVAVWSDGVREDVTPLCRFQTNDDQVAVIDEFGKVTAVGPGDSHVVAFYDNGVVPVPVLFPVSGLTGDAYPEVPTSTTIDELVVRKLRKLGEVPSEPCTDAEFLRRVSLDMTGTLPTAQESQAFLADSRPDKRARKVDELLERPGYAAWWATKFCDWTGNNAQRNQNNGPDRRSIASAAWYEWVRARIAENLPYDELVAGIVLARSRLEDESYEDYCRRMSEYQRKGTEESFASQPYLPYYWSRDNFRTPEERALGFAYTFLGVRIQCAQCHKHPFDQWTKDDFDRFENFFTRVRHGQVPETKSDADEMIAALGIAKSRKGGDLYKELTTLAVDGEVVPYLETYVVPPPKPLSPQAIARLEGAKGANAKKRSQLLGGRTATVLGGREFKIDELADPREVLMDWMRDESNPYFARAIVNRIWAGYFNVGIVEPPDDQSLANPPSNEPLLEYLADGFRTHGYDLKWVHREIALSDTYQRSWRPTETNRLDERNFARSVPRRVPAEAIYDALKIATASDSEAARLTTTMKGRAIAEPVVAARGGGYALGVFGRSIRESNCDCDRSMEPGLLQSVFLQNDQEMLALIDRNGGWVSQVAARTTPSERDVTAARQRAWELKVDQLQAELAEAKEEGDQTRIAAVERRLAFLHKKLEELAPAVAALPQERFRVTAAEREAFAPLVDQAYLRTVGRRPTDGEVARAMEYLRETGDLKLATRDLLWALLNTKEFFVNH